MKCNTQESPESTILQLYQKGYSCKNISEICKIPLTQVSQTLQKNGFATQDYKRISKINERNVVLLIKSGYSYNQIEQILHVSSHVSREIVMRNGLLGFAPYNHPPVKLSVDKEKVDKDKLQKLRVLYLSGKLGLSKCADLIAASDEDLLWFIFYLTPTEKHIHSEKLYHTIKKMSQDNIPASVIAKSIDISLSLVKKHLKK